MSDTPAADLTAGVAAPDYALPGHDGAVHALADRAGQMTVLYFYPKADTSGCTTQAKAFTELADAFEALGVSVLGVSKDPVKKLVKFADKYGLRVTLLSDEQSDTCERYGTWVEKSMYGKTYMGIERSTFLIDGAGRLAQVWRKVKVPGHAEAVLEAVRAAR